MIKWKPVGMHAHFRMLSLWEHMKRYGHRAAHTTPLGIWKKLGSLYNLEVLNEREDVISEGDVDEGEGEGSEDSDATRRERWLPFSLSEEEFGPEMWERRIAPKEELEKRDESPLRWKWQVEQDYGAVEAAMKTKGSKRKRDTTIEDSEGLFILDHLLGHANHSVAEPRSSPGLGRGNKASRGGARGPRRSKVHETLAARGRGRKAKTESADEEEEEDEEEGSEEDDDEDEEGEGSEDQESQPQKRRTSTRGGRGSRGGGRGRVRTRGGRRGK
jgi:MRG-binding protein